MDQPTLRYNKINIKKDYCFKCFGLIESHLSLETMRGRPFVTLRKSYHLNYKLQQEEKHSRNEKLREKSNFTYNEFIQK